MLNFEIVDKLVKKRNAFEIIKYRVIFYYFKRIFS